MRKRGTARIEKRALAGALAAAFLLSAAPLCSNPAATPSGGDAAPTPDSRARMAARHAGAAEFNRVGALPYTFKASFDGKEIERRWSWHPRP